MLVRFFFVWQNCLLIYFLLWAIPLVSAQDKNVVRVFGNHFYSDETILKISGLEEATDFSAIDIQHKLETTGYFSRVRVYNKNNIHTIVVSEKTPWFLLPYFSSDSKKNIYGLAGGLMGLGGGHTMLVGRAQTGAGNRAASLLYRDEFFLDSFWILGASFDFEKVDHDIYRGREIVSKVPNKSSNFTLQSGYHLQPNLIVQFDTHIEQHEYTEAPGQTSSGMQFSHRFLTEYGSYYVNEGLARGYLLKPYVEFTPTWSRYKFYQFGLFINKSVYLHEDFNWIARPRFEHGKPLPFYQRFELGGANLRGFSRQTFRTASYASVQNDFLLSSWNIYKLKIRPMAFVDFAYIENVGRTGLGGGFQVYFRQVAMPAIQLYGGYGFKPNGFSINIAIGPQI
jgi:outer membrane protein assembly factor BamA